MLGRWRCNGRNSSTTARSRGSAHCSGAKHPVNLSETVRTKVHGVQSHLIANSATAPPARDTPSTQKHMMPNSDRYPFERTSTQLLPNGFSHKRNTVAQQKRRLCLRLRSHTHNVSLAKTYYPKYSGVIEKGGHRRQINRAHVWCMCICRTCEFVGSFSIKQVQDTRTGNAFVHLVRDSATRAPLVRSSHNCV